VGVFLGKKMCNRSVCNRSVRNRSVCNRSVRVVCANITRCPRRCRGDTPTHNNKNPTLHLTFTRHSNHLGLECIYVTTSRRGRE
jgi:hypothetical protein